MNPRRSTPRKKRNPRPLPVLRGELVVASVKLGSIKLPLTGCWVVLAVVGVWTAEALNTALEFLCDVASPEFHPLVEKSKDVAAGAVLIAALGAVAIGILVFGPHVLEFAGSR